MKNFKYCFLIGCLLFFTSCEDDVKTPGIEITTDATTYQAGQPVVFKFRGYADIIAFYSGEPSHDYSYKEGREIDLSDGSVSLAFTSAVTGGDQADQLSLLASTDFDGDFSSLESVKQATWTDISNRFTLGTTATFANSTVQDITDLIEPGKPIYFAFRYHTRPQADNGLARTWMIQTFALTSSVLYLGAPVTITDQVNAGFRIVDQEPENAPARASITTTRVSLLGNVYKDPADPIYDPENPIFDPANPIYDPNSPSYDPTAVRPTYAPYDPNSPYNDPETETWAVSKPLYVNKVDMGPDRSVPVKGIANAAIEEYQHVYETPGTYKAYFVAINATIDEQREVVKEFTLTINP